MPGSGDVAEWLGRGLQSLVHQFESGRRLYDSDPLLVRALKHVDSAKPASPSFVLIQHKLPAAESTVGTHLYNPLVIEHQPTPAPPAAESNSATEPCWRCGTAMEWRHSTLQCPRCHFKIGCCEGRTAECSPQDR